MSCVICDKLMCKGSGPIFSIATESFQRTAFYKNKYIPEPQEYLGDRK